jgi:hypothetical protein
VGERRGPLLFGRSVPVVIIIVLVVIATASFPWPVVIVIVIVIASASLASRAVVFIRFVIIIATAFAAWAFLFVVGIASPFTPGTFLFVIFLVNAVLGLLLRLRHLGLDLIEEAALLLGFLLSGCCLLHEEAALLLGLLVFGLFALALGRWWRRRRRCRGLWPRCGFGGNRPRRGRGCRRFVVHDFKPRGRLGSGNWEHGAAFRALHATRGAICDAEFRWAVGTGYDGHERPRMRTREFVRARRQMD